MSGLAAPVVQRQSEAAPFRGGSGPSLQRSALQVSSPQDSSEREASSVARAVMTMDGGRAHRVGSTGAVIQRSAAPAAPSGGDTAARIQGSLAGGSPLPPSVRRFMEPRFGASFAGVRVHADANAATLSRQVSAHAFTTGNHIFFGRDQFQPETAAGRELIAHELTHTIQQGAVARDPPARLQRQADLTITPQPAGVIQRSPFDSIADRLAALAANVPGFTLLTLIIGRNPINMRVVERNASNVLRAFMGLIPGGEILFQVLDRYGVIQRLGAWALQQTAALGLSFQGIRDAFGRFTDSLGVLDVLSPGDVWRRAREVFTPTLGRITAFVAGLVGQAISWLKDTFMEPLAAFCREIPGYGLVTVMLGRDPFTNAPVPRTALTVVRAFAEFIPGGSEKVNQLVESRALDRAHAWFTTETAARNLTWTRVTGTFAEAWASLRLEDVLHPIETLRRMITLFRPLMIDLVSFAGAALMKLLELIFEAVMGAGGARILAILKRARATFLIVINDPVGFLRNLLGAVGQGVRQFMTNILTHLRTGVIAWLTGPVAAAGIQMPERWDLRGIIGFVLQILGLTWARVREKLVRLMGERVVGLLERGFQLIQDIRDRGLAQALRERVTEFFGSLREAALGAIRSFIQQRLVQAGITQLLSLLSPVGAVIQAIMKTYTTIQFFIQRINQILDLVESVVNSIAAIASGAIGAAAGFVERTMARTIPVILDFLARFIGLGDVGAQVQTTIRNLQGSVDRMLDRAVEWIRNQARSLGSAAARGVRSAAAGLGARFRRDVDRTVRVGSETHTVRAHTEDGRTVFLMASGEFASFPRQLQRIRTDYVSGLFPRTGMLSLAAQLDVRLRAAEARHAAIALAVSEAESADRGTSDAPNPRRDQLVNQGVDELRDMLRRIAEDFTFGGGAHAQIGQHIVITLPGRSRGAVVNEIGMLVANHFGLRVANPDGSNPQLLTYAQYGTGWTIPASGKPAYIPFAGSAGTGTRTVRIDVVPHPHGRDPSVDPPGHSSSGLWNRRGHLVAKMFGGPGSRDNLVAMTFAANQTNAGMRSIEDQVRDDIRQRGSVFDYRVTPRYFSPRNPAFDAPNEVSVVADELYPNSAAGKFSKVVGNS